MKIDLRTIPTFIISSADQATRRKHMADMCQSLGLQFEIIDGISCTPGYIGCMLSHLKALSLPSAKPPFLILEDDCSPGDAFQPVIDVPTETDIVYLGISVYGYVPQVHQWGIPFTAYAKPFNSEFHRVENMLSTHAMLFLSKSFQEKAKAGIVESAVTETPFDIAMAKLQAESLALTTAKPFFFQDEKIGGMESATKDPLNVLRETDTLKITKNNDDVEIIWRSGEAQPKTRDIPSERDNIFHRRALEKKLEPYLRVVNKFIEGNPNIYENLQKQRQIETRDGYSLKPFDQTRSIFFHIPKTAGISMARALYGNLAGGHRNVLEQVITFGPEKFLDYFKFAIVRNPWDRLVSAFDFLKSGGFNPQDRQWAEQNLNSYPDFKSFVMKGLDNEKVMAQFHFSPQSAFVCLPKSNDVMLDYVGFFETLDESFAAICRRLGKQVALGRENQTAGPRGDYRERYDSESRNKIAEVYRQDIECFGYAFDNRESRLENVADPLDSGGDDAMIVYNTRSKTIQKRSLPSGVK